MGCAASTAPPVPPSTPAPPTRDWGLRVFDTAQGTETDVSTLLDALVQYDFVLVGETHLDDQTHRLELAILEGLVKRAGAESVTLSMEMFRRDQQAVLDAYVQGTLTEAQFVERAPPWPNYRTGYRPLVEFAKQHRLPVIGANLPRDLQRAFGRKGASARNELDDGQRAMLPATVHPPTESYWTRVDRRLRDAGHGHPGKLDAEARTWSVQNLWDNSMADAMVRAAERRDGVVVHMVGAFHAEYGDGIAAQLRHRRPDAKIAIVTIDPVDDLRRVDPRADEARADFLVYALADAQGFSGGMLRVTVPSELRYRLHAPTVGQPDGLLIWLGDDETSERTAMAYWRAVLGERTMIAIVRPPHRLRTDDLRLAGRWSWPDSFGDDLGRVVQGLDGMIRYLGARWTLDPQRIVIAGRGGGADAALWAGLYSNTPATIVAARPDHPARIGEAGIPSRTATPRRVVLLDEADRSKPVSSTLALAEIAVEQIATEPSLRTALEHQVRAGLGRPPANTPADTESVELILNIDTPLARQWGALHARLAERSGTAHRLRIDTRATPTLTVQPADFADGAALPSAPGPFGGTTILVLPPGVSKSETAAWRALSEPDVLRARSRFSRLVVVSDATLGARLDGLREQGKRNMLIVPATFVAPPARMQALRRLVDGHADGLDVHWLPGLGGELGRSRAEATAEH